MEKKDLKNVMLRMGVSHRMEEGWMGSSAARFVEIPDGLCCCVRNIR